MSSSSFNAFARALSPGLETLAQLTINNTLVGEGVGTDSVKYREEILTKLHTAVSNSLSIDAIANAVFVDYRVPTRDWLIRLSSWIDKRESVKAVYDRISPAVANADYPQRLHVKLPEFQLTQEFRESGGDEAAKALSDLSDVKTAYQASFATAAVKAKKAELEFWVGKTDMARCIEDYANLVSKTWKEKKPMFKIPSLTVDDEGKHSIGPYVTSPQKTAERDVLVACGSILASQVEIIVTTRHKVLATKIEKKREVAAKADVEMVDATKPGPALQSMIDKAIRQRLKNVRLDERKKAQKSSAPGPSKTPAGPSKKTSSSSSNSKPGSSKPKAASTAANKKLAGKKSPAAKPNKSVVVPPTIANELSVGMKYMFFTRPSSKLIKTAWHEFQARLRWQIFFLFKDGPNRPFDPDYAVTDKSKKGPPMLPLWMELGLKMGARYVNNTIAKIPEETVKAMHSHPLTPNTEKVLSFLTEHDYVLTMTDKNLGLAVSKREWLRSNELKLLQDERNYKELAYVEACKVMAQKCTEMQELSARVFAHIELSSLKVDKFFESKITEKGKAHTFPQFYGIPKIHKKPTGFRPIVPCHSVVFNPAAKFISKELKPLVKAAETIIHGTKDMLGRLSQTRIDARRKWYFVTGDVVAYYPNIPLESCIEIVSN
ncbi:hypothetical protein CVT26_012306, partial [Gymnopilus dilepis]